MFMTAVLTMAKRKSRSNFDPISLAFLDVMSCGFGAAILLFLIIDHNVTEARTQNDPLLSAEVAMLEVDVREGQENLFQVRNTLDEINLEVVEAQGLAERVQSDMEDFMSQLAAMEGNSMATEESLQQLRADIQAMEEELLRLQASAAEERGISSREFVGDGDRQYLTGMFLGGNRILILLDSSASMLDDTLVNIIRTRNMADEVKRNAPKWQRAVRIVEWISSQLPLVSQYQVMTFNESVTSVLDGSNDEWLEVADQDQLNEVIRQLKLVSAGGGNNLEAAFRAVASMSPPPDNVYLITDSLPTQGSRPSSASIISPRDRLRLFSDALEALPQNIPVNTILLPMEGDPASSAAFWQLALSSGGSFITPSRDWP
jgi:hypothetical protein